VGAVVLVLGFSSGIGSIVGTRRTAYQASGPPEAPTASGVAGVVAGITPVPAGAATPAAGDSGSMTTEAAAGSTMTAGQARPAGTKTTVGDVPVPAQAAATPPWSVPDAPVSGAAGTCSAKSVVSAMAEPLMTHLNKAHLETSPGQQVADLLSVDQYVKTHTVLLESILQPLLDVVMAAPDGLAPLMTHLDKAHLETSPGQQVADLLSVDQYVKTHTVLAEAIAAPTVDSAMGTKACG